MSSEKSFKFDDALLGIFECSRGGFSKVTENEFDKSQVTLVGIEQEIVESLVADIALRYGDKAQIKELAGSEQVTVRRWPDGEQINVTLYYKPEKDNSGPTNELRMYLNKSFKPEPGVNWCIFDRDTELWIGQFSDDAFELPSNPVSLVKALRPQLEPETDDYQAAINSGSPESVQSVVTKWKRNPKIGARAIKSAGYKCEVEPEAPTFNSRYTGKPFMEAHHLVPMKVQSDFKGVNLDSTGNICSLGPMAHRKIHFAPLADIVDSIASLHDRKKDFMDELGISVDDLIKIYGG